MIVMRVTGENDLRVGIFETEPVDVLLHEREVFRKIRIDQNVSLRRVDQINRQISRSNPIQIAGDFERRKLAMKVRILLCRDRRRQYEQQKQASFDQINL